LFDALADDLSQFLSDEVFIVSNQTIDYKEGITEMIKESQSYRLIDKYLTSQLGDYKLSDWHHNEEEYTNKHGDVIIFLDRVHEGYTQIGISEDIYDLFGSLFSLDNDKIQIHLLKWFKDHMEINNAEEIEVFSI
jgi:regulator of replication initiation timing